ncbi:MAG: DNA repair protein RecO, partial [Chloroflexi bacterium]
MTTTRSEATCTRCWARSPKRATRFRPGARAGRWRRSRDGASRPFASSPKSRSRTIRWTAAAHLTKQWRKELATYRDRAVVLRKLDYGEADRIFTFLTRTHGKVGAIAKGVRRPESKLGPSLELYGHVDVLLAKGRGELDVVAQVQRVPGYRIEGDVERMAHAALIAELAERVCEDRHPVDGVYELTVTALDELARETDPRR